jgi:hypothetical protein
MEFPLKWLLFNRWLWITIMGAAAVLTLPFIVIFGMLVLPPTYRAVATLLIVVGSGVAGGYKDWVISKRREEKMKIKV